MGRLSQLEKTKFHRQVLALGCAVLVFFLGIIAVSPELHERLHAGPQASAEDTCAVALFASGVSLTVPVLALPPASAQWSELPAAAAPEFFLESPRYLLQPERGPPVA